MANVIITGGSGFIGKYLIRENLIRGNNVYAVIRNSNSITLVEKFLKEYSICLEKLNFIIAEYATLSDGIFPKNDYWLWIHAGWGGVDRQHINDAATHLENYNCSIRYLEIANELKCKNFIDIGSRAEYGCKEAMFEESDSCDTPLNMYGNYKRKFYDYAYLYCLKNQIFYLHVILFSVIGKEDHPWSIIMQSCESSVMNCKMEYGACEQMWNFIWVGDVGRAIMELANQIETLPQKDNRIVNIASKQSRRLKDYILSIYSIANSHIKPEFGEKKGFPSYPSVQKLHSLIDWKEERSFEDTVDEIIRDIVNNGVPYGKECKK